MSLPQGLADFLRVLEESGLDRDEEGTEFVSFPFSVKTSSLLMHNERRWEFKDTDGWDDPSIY